MSDDLSHSSTIFLRILAGREVIEATVIVEVDVPKGSVAGNGVLVVIWVQVGIVSLAMSLLMTGMSVPESLFHMLVMTLLASAMTEESVLLIALESMLLAEAAGAGVGMSTPTQRGCQSVTWRVIESAVSAHLQFQHLQCLYFQPERCLKVAKL